MIVVERSSPELIRGKSKLEYMRMVSYETIYKFI